MTYCFSYKHLCFFVRNMLNLMSSNDDMGGCFKFLYEMQYPCLINECEVVIGVYLRFRCDLIVVIHALNSIVANNNLCCKRYMSKLYYSP